MKKMPKYIKKLNKLLLIYLICNKFTINQFKKTNFKKITLQKKYNNY